LISTLALPVDSQEVGAVLERPPEYRDSATVYLNMKNAEFIENDKALKAAGKTQNVTPLYNIMKEKRRFVGRNVIGKDEATKGKVVDALAMTAAQYLASAGMSPSEVNRLEKLGYDVSASVEPVIAAEASIEDAVVVNEIPVLASISNKNEQSALLEYEVSVSVERNLKSVKKLPQSLSFTVMSSDPVAGLSTETKCVFFLSKAYKQFQSAIGIGTIVGEYAQQTPPFCLIEGKFVSLSGSGLSPESDLIQVEMIHSKLGK
jgi:hypothetical protein